MSEKLVENSAPPSIAPGDLLVGKYRVERVLGSGGMGVVVAARHEELDQLVAIKLLRPDLAQTEVAIARFHREARASARIQSDHVARVYDVGTLEDGRVYMIMEYLHGIDLGKMVEARGALPIPEAVTYVLEALEALAHAHAEGIIHRDLKPSNLFLTKRSDGLKRVKVLDFGISKSASPLHKQASSALTTDEALLGSPGYMSPEQVRSSKDVDGRTDIWSMGVILYELLTGTQPFKGDTIGDMLANILEGPPERVGNRRPSIPVELDCIVMRCLERRPAARFATAAELAEALAPFSEEGSKSIPDRISVVLGRAGDAPSSKRGSARISVSPGEVVSQTGDTFNASGPRSRRVRSDPNADTLAAPNTPASAATHGHTAQTWAQKPERSEGSSPKRRLAASVAVAGLIALGGLFTWRMVAAPAGEAGHEESLGAASAKKPAGEAAPGTSAPMVVPAPTIASAMASATASAASSAAPTASQSAAPTSPSASARKAGAPITKEPAKAAPKAATKSIPTNLLLDRD